MKRILSVLMSLLIISACCIFPAEAKDAVNLNISKNNISHEVSPTLYGAFIEDISKACDGGLVSNLIYNNSFEYNDTAEENHKLNEAYWTFDNITHEIKSTNPLNSKNRNYEVLTVSGKGTVKNLGCVEHWDYKTYDPSRRLQSKADMGFKEGEKYDFSCYFKNIDFEGTVTVYLDSPSNANHRMEIDISTSKADWREITCELDSLATEDGGLAIEFNGKGSVQIDFAQLIPQNSYGYGTTEWQYTTLRADLFEAFKNLNPSFIRFPGGCFCEGDSLDRLFNWKNTIGPVEEREQSYNVWRNDGAGDYYINSNFMGYGEYFNLCSDLGAEPVPCLNVGLTCQGRNGYDLNVDALKKLSMTDDEFTAYLIEKRNIDKDRVQDRINEVNALGYTSEADFDRYLETIALTPGTDEWNNYVQDILDLVEYANGDANTTYWGALRAAYGHPEPYNLKYIGLGNENWGDVYWRNFDALYNAVKTAYPDLQIITTSGTWLGGDEFDRAWSTVNEKYADCYVDEHYYTNDAYMYEINDRYDSYDRNGGKVFVGEYSATSPGIGTIQTKSNIIEAVEEAAYMTGFERNGDIVKMTAYAPTFAKINSQNWNVNEIWFDSQEVVLTPSYFTQMLYANNVGTKYIDADFDTDVPASELAQSVTVDEEKQVIYVKLVNSSNSSQTVNLNIDGFENLNSISHYHFSGNFKSACNEIGKPYYVAPTEDITVIPKSDTITVETDEYSVNVISIAYGSNSGEGHYQLPENIPSVNGTYLPPALKVAIPCTAGAAVLAIVLAEVISKAVKKRGKTNE